MAARRPLTQVRSVVAEVLRAERQSRGVTLTDMAKRLGVSKQSVANVEQHTRSMGEEMMIRYAEALGCELVVTLRERP